MWISIFNLQYHLQHCIFYIPNYVSTLQQSMFSHSWMWKLRWKKTKKSLKLFSKMKLWNYEIVKNHSMVEICNYTFYYFPCKIHICAKCHISENVRRTGPREIFDTNDPLKTNHINYIHHHAKTTSSTRFWLYKT